MASSKSGELQRAQKMGPLGPFSSAFLYTYKQLHVHVQARETTWCWAKNASSSRSALSARVKGLAPPAWGSKASETADSIDGSPAPADPSWGPPATLPAPPSAPRLESTVGGPGAVRFFFFSVFPRFGLHFKAPGLHT